MESRNLPPVSRSIFDLRPPSDIIDGTCRAFFRRTTGTARRRQISEETAERPFKKLVSYPFLINDDPGRERWKTAGRIRGKSVWKKRRIDLHRDKLKGKRTGLGTQENNRTKRQVDRVFFLLNLYYQSVLRRRRRRLWRCVWGSGSASCDFLSPLLAAVSNATVNR